MMKIITAAYVDASQTIIAATTADGTTCFVPVDQMNKDCEHLMAGGLEILDAPVPVQKGIFKAALDAIVQLLKGS